MRYGFGVWVVPNTGVKSGCPPSSGQTNVNFLSRVTTMRNSSIRARPSPRQTRGPVTKPTTQTVSVSIQVKCVRLWKEHWCPSPVEKGMKASGLKNSPWSLRKFSGSNSWGDFHCPSSNSTEDRFGTTVVPWRAKSKLTQPAEAEVRPHLHSHQRTAGFLYNLIVSRHIELTLGIE